MSLCSSANETTPPDGEGRRVAYFPRAQRQQQQQRGRRQRRERWNPQLYALSQAPCTPDTMATATPTASASAKTQPTAFMNRQSTRATTTPLLSSTSPPSSSSLSPAIAAAETTTSSSLSSDKLWQHLSSTLELVHSRLAEVPEIQLLVQSASLSCDRLQARVRTYEALLPRLKALVSRQRDELAFSATLLGQARHAYRQLHHRCQKLQQSNTARLDDSRSTALSNVGIQTDFVGPNEQHGASIGAAVAAAATAAAGSNGIVRHHGHDELQHSSHEEVGASASFPQESTLVRRIQALEVELQDVKGQLRDSTTKMKVFQGTLQTYEAQAASWRRRAEFQEKVNDKLRRVIETQEQLLDDRSSSKAHGYGNNDSSSPTTSLTSQGDCHLPDDGSRNNDLPDSTWSDDEQNANDAIYSNNNNNSNGHSDHGSGNSGRFHSQSPSSGSRPPRSPPSAHRQSSTRASSPAARHTNGRSGTLGDSPLRPASLRRFGGTSAAADIYSISS